MSLYDQARDGMSRAEETITGLPVIEDYRSKEMRRDADKRMREQIALQLEGYQRKLTGLQLDMVNAGKLRILPDMERAVGRLQLLIDRIRTASYGYAPFFDIDEVREEELDRLIAFDRAIAEEVPVVAMRIDDLATATKAVGGFDEALDALMNTLGKLHERFDKRDQVMSFMAGTGNSLPALEG